LARQGGEQLCRIACSSSISILQLKTKVEVGAGIEAATLAICMPEVEQSLGESFTLDECGLPTKLLAIKLHKVDIADMMGVSPVSLTDVQLAEACSIDEAKAGDIVLLKGCNTLCDMSCLVWLEQMQTLDISGCKLNIDAAATAATAIVAHK
jgi:hypothetical protein